MRLVALDEALLQPQPRNTDEFITVVQPVSVEVELEPVRPDRLRLQVDGQLAALLHERLHLFLRQRHRHEADLDAVRAEDVPERGRHDRLEAPVLERPGRVLPRRATSEIGACQENRRIAERIAIEDKLGVFPALRIESPIVKEEVAEARSLNPFEELLGNDGVGVDVDSVQRCDQAFMADERLHNNPPGDSP